MNVKHEALYFSLSGYAKTAFENLGDDRAGDIPRMVLSVNKHFKNIHTKKTRRSKEDVIQITNWLDKKLDPALTKMGRSSAELLLIVTLDYLINIAKHTTTIIHFGHINLKALMLEINEGEYSQELESHIVLIGKLT